MLYNGECIKEKLVDGEMVDQTPTQQKMDFLSEEYPSLYIFILEYCNMTERIEEYMNKCKTYSMYE